MKRRVLTMLCLIGIVASIQAQSVYGRLMDEEKQPLPYVNVVLQEIDSTFVKGGTSDEKGYFRISKVSPGNYRLMISSIGYHPLYIDLQNFGRTADLGTLTLREDVELLGEVTVTASSFSAAVDKKMVFPNQQQVKASTNGVDLLRNLMIPRLNINPMDNSVSTTDGGSVQLAINGRKVTKEEVVSLQPADIIRVEMLEDPGLRYGDANAVVNYVVRHYDMGGSLGYGGVQSIKSWFGDCNVNGKLNFGKSEFSFYYSNNLQFFKDIWFDRNETFIFEDGKQYHRHAHNDTDGLKNFQEWGSITYNLQNGDKDMFNASVKLTHNNDPARRYYGELYTEEYPDIVTYRQESHHNRSLSPSIDLYYQRNLKNQQFLALNAVGTYIGTKNRTRYLELLGDETVVDYISGAEGKKYSFILEGIYEKEFKHGGRLTSGIKHTKAYTSNIYIGTLHFDAQMNQADTYTYAQYQGKWKKLHYGIGMGISRSWLHQEGEDDYETWTPNPRFNLRYTFNDHWNANLEMNVGTDNPTLSQISAVEQLTDSLQITRGNPELSPYTSYKSSFRMNYNKGKWNIGLFGNYSYQSDVIMPHIYRENGKFIHSYANHDYFRKLNTGINARVGMLWNVLQLSGSIYSDAIWSYGLDYRHKHHSIGWDISALLMYKNFMAYAVYHHNNDTFFGELLTTGENDHLIQLQYRLKNVTVGLRMLHFLQKDYARKEKDYNRYAGYDYKYHVDEIARMICITASWNFSFGRDYKGQNKRMNNSDSDSGVM